MSMRASTKASVNLTGNRDIVRREKILRASQFAPQIASRTRTRCHLCGFAEVRTDEVADGMDGVDREILFLAECPRCENRWTSRVPIGSPVSLAAPVRLVAGCFQRVPARVARSIAPAA